MATCTSRPAPKRLALVTVPIAALVLALLGLGSACAKGTGAGVEPDEGTATGTTNAGTPTATAGGAGGIGGTGTAAGGAGATGGGGIGGGGATGGTGGAAGGTCFSYANDLDSAGAAGDWNPVNVPVGTQWGQFGHHWAWGTPTSGPNADHTGGGSLWAVGLSTQQYPYFESSYLEGPSWDLSGATSAQLSFWHWYEVEWCTSGCGTGNPVPTALDGAQVVCWNGTDWQLAAPTGGYAGTIRMFDSAISPPHPLKDQPGFRFDPTHPQYDAAWRQVTIELPTACLRADAQVRLQFGSDSSSAALNGAGWFVDDVVVAAVCN